MPAKPDISDSAGCRVDSLPIAMPVAIETSISSGLLVNTTSTSLTGGFVTLFSIDTLREHHFLMDTAHYSLV